MMATGGEADVKGKRKREMNDGNQKFTGEQPTFETPKRTTPEKLMNYSIIQDCQAVASDQMRQRWLSKCAYAVQKALPANEKDNDGTCVPAFVGHLLASFETSAHQELRFDLEKYSAVMEQLLSNIEKFNPSNAPKKKLLSRTHDTNERETKKQRKTEAEWLFLDRHGHGLVKDGGGVVPWTATGVTRHGVSIKLSLCVQEPPCISWLLFMAEVPHSVLTFSVTHDISSVLVVSSHENILLLEASCVGTTRDYFVLHLVVPPVLTCLPPHFTFEMEIQGRKGIMRREDGGYVVAVLEQGVGEAWHVSFFSTPSSSSSAGGAWRRRPANLAPELDDWNYWEISAELACGGRFWWLDLRRGLLSCSCDSLLEESNGTDQTTPLALEFTPLPNVSMDEAKGARFSDYDLLQDRCVMASGGHLTYVDVRVVRRLPRGAPLLCDGCHGGSVTTWTLDHIGGAWVKVHQVTLSDVWKDDSYGSLCLPEVAPEFPHVDPFDADIVYFSIMEGREGTCRDFGVNLRTRSVTSCSLSHNILDVSHPLQPVLMASSGKSCLSGDNSGVSFD